MFKLSADDNGPFSNQEHAPAEKLFQTLGNCIIRLQVNSRIVISAICQCFTRLNKKIQIKTS